MAIDAVYLQVTKRNSLLIMGGAMWAIGLILFLDILPTPVNARYKFLGTMGVRFQEVGRHLPSTSSHYEVLFKIALFPMPKLKRLPNVKFCRVKRTGPNCGKCIEPYCPTYCKRTVKGVVQNVQGALPYRNLEGNTVRAQGRLRGRSFSEHDTGTACLAVEDDVNHLIDMYNQRLPYIKIATRTARDLTRGFAPIVGNSPSFNSTKGMPRSKRLKRYFTNFIGDGVGPAFGLQPRSEANRMQDQIDQLNQNDRIFRSTVSDMRTGMGKVVDVQNQRYRNILAMNLAMQNNTDNNMQILQKADDSLTKQLTGVKKELLKRHTWVVQLLDTQFRAQTLLSEINEYILHACDWTNSLLMLADYKLPPNFVPVSVLTTTLKRVQRDITKSYPGYRVQHKSNTLLYYYSHALVKAVVHKERLYLHLRVPVANSKNVLATYHVTSFPIPLHPNMQHEHNDTVGHVQLALSSPYLLVSYSGKYYRELTTDEFEFCKDNTQGICSALMVMDEAETHPTCLIALFNNNIRYAVDHCDYRFFPVDLPTSVLHIVDSTYAVQARNAPAELNCQGNQSTINVTGLTLVDIPCECDMRIGYKYVPALISGCMVQLEVVVKYPLNLVQYLLLDLENALIIPPVDFIFDNNIVYNVSERVTAMDMRNYTDRDKELGVNLRSLVDTYFKGRMSIDTSVSIFGSMPTEYLTIWIIDLLWGLILSGILGFVAYKLNQLSTLVAILSCKFMAVHKAVEAKVVLSGKPPLPTDRVITDAEYLKVLYLNLSPHVYEICQCGAVMLIAIALCYIVKLKSTIIKGNDKSHVDCSTSVMLVILNRRRSITLNIREIPFSMLGVRVKILPCVLSMQVESVLCIKRTVTVEWDVRAVSLSYLGHDFSVNLPARVSCPLASLRLLNMIENERPILNTLAYLIIKPSCACMNSDNLNIHGGHVPTRDMVKKTVVNDMTSLTGQGDRIPRAQRAEYMAPATQ